MSRSTRETKHDNPSRVILKSKSMEDEEQITHRLNRKLRSKSSPGTPKEEAENIQICFKGDGSEEITFILTHSNRFFDGFHLGMLIRDTTTGNTNTLGFYPKHFGAKAVIKSMIKAQDGAIYIPDPFIEMGLNNSIGKTILNQTPLILSKSASDKLNKYTCNGSKGSEINVELSGRSSKSSGRFIITKRFITDEKFSIAFGNDSCTNCQGFISKIFMNDPDVIKIISPYLYKSEPIIRENALKVAKQLAESERNRPLGLYSDGTHRTRASMGIFNGLGIGGRKSKKNTRKKRNLRNKRKTLRKNKKKKKHKKTHKK